MNNNPIAIFDSGMGGLTVRAAIEAALPRESLIYFGDGANVPYGPRPSEEIVTFVDRAFEILAGRGVKLAVVACNAATGAAIDHLRGKYDFPIVGMEPAVKPAALTTRTGTIGVLATAAALQGRLYRATAARYRDEVTILETVGEGFVELVEEGREESAEALETVRRAVVGMLEAGADRIVLGCTHYPYLAAQIERVIGERTEWREVQIVDSAPAIVRRVERLLTDGNLHAAPDIPPSHEFLSFADESYTEKLKRKAEAYRPR